MDFLNSEKQTIYGPGLGLEVGNSFWFFNGSKSAQLSYFEGLTDKETALAPIIRLYIKSKHIDTLHSWEILIEEVLKDLCRKRSRGSRKI